MLEGGNPELEDGASKLAKLAKPPEAAAKDSLEHSALYPIKRVFIIKRVNERMCYP